MRSGLKGATDAWCRKQNTYTALCSVEAAPFSSLGSLSQGVCHCWRTYFFNSRGNRKTSKMVSKIEMHFCDSVVHGASADVCAQIFFARCVAIDEMRVISLGPSCAMLPVLLLFLCPIIRYFFAILRAHLAMVYFGE